MSPLLARKLRFSDAAFAINATPKTLRNWLQRDQVKLFSGQPEGWREFSYADIAVLALVRKLVAFGVEVEEASSLAHEAFSKDWLLLQYRNTPPDALAAAWTNLVLAVWLDGNRWAFNIMTPGGDVLNRKGQYGRSGFEQSDGTPLDAQIFISVDRVLRRAFERAEESNAEGAE